MSEHETPKREDVKYPQVVRTITETAWAILPTTLAAIKEMVAIRASGQHLSDEEIQARIGGRGARRDLLMVGSVAVIPVYGVITPRADLFTEISGGTSIQRLSSSFRDALDDDKVSAIVFDVDSPGGSAAMIPEFASEVRAARGKKPIVAVADSLAASAGYWILSQADEAVMTPSGMVGSIGVFAAHEDISGMEEKLGVKTTLISAGKYKVEGNPFEPLSEDARAAIQERVDETYRVFTTDVAKGRGVPVETVRNGFGQGRVLQSRAALKEGMVDRIETLEETVARLTRGVKARDPRAPEPDPLPMPDPADEEAAASGLSFADEATELHGSASALVARLSSLAEVKAGRLTKAKRESLAACPAALREAADAIAGVLAATDPDKHRADLEREFLRFEMARANL